MAQLPGDDPDDHGARMGRLKGDEEMTQPATTTPVPSVALVRTSADEGAAFELEQRKARALMASSLVPQAFRSLPDVLVALEMARRIGASPLMIMQNLYVVHGKPGWSSSFLIATVNSSGKFTPLRFEWRGEENKPSWACRAYAEDKASGCRCDGAWISWAMVTAEGWDKKPGSKWKTMPEQMFIYRAAAFWTRAFAPELSLGMRTVDEYHDTYGAAVPQELRSGDAATLEAELLGDVPDTEPPAEREPGEEG